MNGQPYIPLPGTIERKCVEWLRTMPPGTERSTVELAEYCGQQLGGFVSYLKTAREVGLLIVRNREGERALYWSLDPAKLWPENEAAAATQPTKPKRGDQPRSERGRGSMELEACESATGRGTTGAPALATSPVHESPGVGPMGSGQPADAGPTRMRCALWNDNELVIERPGQKRIVFDADETRELLGYLFRMEGQA